MTQKELLEGVGNADKLSHDFAFRNSFIANPKTILEKEFGFNTNSLIHVHENTVREMHVILVPTEGVVFGDTLDERVEAVLDKAFAQHNFRKLLIADPKGTLEKELPDFFVPDDFRIYFHENSAAEIHLLIPALAGTEEELSEAELDAVAGGSKGKGPHIGRKRGGSGPRCRSQRF